DQNRYRVFCLEEKQLKERQRVFLVEVLCNGRRHTVAKRYSEFQALHKRIKKTCKVPDFPPRRVPNWVPKVLEQRRQGLELYIQGVLCRNKELPQDVLDFLKVRRCQQDPKGSRTGVTPLSPAAVHPVPRPPFIGAARGGHRAAPAPLLADALPDTVLSGVLQGLYAPWSCSPCAAMAQGQPGS
uniref:Sorting nexin 22 n=1 Tax=Cairina moschata TaxID=8855 RepID=A0A8C3GCQ7_CAIMO